MKHLCWIALSCLVLVHANPVQAQGSIYLGKLHVVPGIAYQAEYNDNIYLSHTDETEDFIHTVTPGIQLEYRTGEQRYIRTGYELAIVRYSEESDNKYEEHQAILEARYSSPAGWYVGLEDTFVHTEDPYSTANNYKLGTHRVRRWTNTAQALLGYEFANKLKARVAYSNSLKRYEDFQDQWRDREDHIYDGRVMYPLWPKTSIFTHYRLQDINYPNQEDTSDNDRGIDSNTSQNNLYHQIFAGLSFSPATKINGELKLGTGKKDYENKQNWNGHEYNDDWHLTAEAELDYLYSAETRFDLRLMRASYASVEHEASSYTLSRIELGAEQDLGKRFTLHGGVGYALWDFETGVSEPSRTDHTYGASAGMGYKLLDWLDTGVEYNYEARSISDRAYRAGEYVNNRVKWTLSAQY